MNDDPGDWFQVYAFLNALALGLQFKTVDAFESLRIFSTPIAVSITALTIWTSCAVVEALGIAEVATETLGKLASET